MPDEQNENVYVPNDYMPAEPILPAGFSYASVFMNGKSVATAPPNDPALSFGNMSQTGGTSPSAQLRTLAIMADFIQNGYTKVVSVEYKVRNVIVKNILPNSTGVGCDVYITFELGENQYWSRLVALGNPAAEQVLSNVEVGNDKMLASKIYGHIKQIVKEWMAIKPDTYTVNVDNLYGYDQSGNVLKVAKGSKISVAWSDKEDMKAGIIVKETTLELRAPIYYYLNYYLTKKA